jgi:hypothetical protein
MAILNAGHIQIVCRMAFLWSRKNSLTRYEMFGNAVLRQRRPNMSDKDESAVIEQIIYSEGKLWRPVENDPVLERAWKHSKRGYWGSKRRIEGIYNVVECNACDGRGHSGDTVIQPGDSCHDCDGTGRRLKKSPADAE